MTAPAKPPIDELIEFAKSCTAELDDHRFDAILATLEAHKRITEVAGRPEPVAWMMWMPMSGKGVQFTTDAKSVAECNRADIDITPLYGPDLLAYADRMRAERDAERDRGDQWEITATNLLNRAETAERQLAELQAKHDALVKRLREPTDSMNKAGVAAGNEQASHAQHCDEVFTAMSAVALREEEE